MDNNNESRSMKNTTINRENDSHEDEILSFKEKVHIDEKINISEMNNKKEKNDKISEIELNYDINQFNINDIKEPNENKNNNENENNKESNKQITIENNKNKDNDKNYNNNNNGNPTASEKDKESNLKLLNVYEDIKETNSLLNDNEKNDNNSLSENNQKLKGKEQKKSSSDEIEKSETEILEEFNHLREELINYTDKYFNDEENYILPDINIMNKYPLILLNFEEEEELPTSINYYYEKDTLEQKLNFFIEKKYIEDRLVGIKYYLKKKFNDSSKFEYFLEFFGESPFFGCKNIIKKYDLSFYNFEIKNSNNLKAFEFMKNSTIGDIEHFTNLLYKYKIYKNNEIKNEKENKENEQIKEYKNKSNIDYLTSTLKDLGYNSNTKYDIVYFYRKVINDGNSFYRAFMFGLIEIYILYNIQYLKSLIILMRLISINYKKIIFKDINVNYTRCLTRLEEILNYLKNNLTQKALELFYNSFSLSCTYFDDFLIIFLKFILYYSK